MILYVPMVKHSTNINPTTAAVEAGLTTPGMMIEILADAIIHNEDGKI